MVEGKTHFANKHFLFLLFLASFSAKRKITNKTAQTKLRWCFGILLLSLLRALTTCNSVEKYRHKELLDIKILRGKTHSLIFL